MAVLKKEERGRFTVRRKTEAVIRLLKGEDLDTVSRELGVTAATLSEWREAFLVGAEANLKTREPTPADDENLRLNTKIGELTMENELLRHKAEKLEVNAPIFSLEEVEEMSRATSPSAKKPYGLTWVCRAWSVSRATVYRRRASEARDAPHVLGKRGPKTRWSDAELLALIREDLSATEWIDEGHRKVWARLRALKQVRKSLRRVLRLIRETNLMAPARPRREPGPRVHDGTIIPEAPNEMWGIDATAGGVPKIV